MRIHLSAWGDYSVTSTFSFTASDIMSAAHQISREYDDVVFDWPVVIEEHDGIWGLWFLTPIISNNYLDFEELV